MAEPRVRPFAFIKDVNEKKDFWKLAVRVRDKWTVVKDGKEHIEMVIVDAKGADIQVIIPTGYKADSEKILAENSTYTLSNFQVMTNDLVFKASENKYKLKWTGGTSAEDVNLHQIPDPPIKFKPLAEIVAGKWRADLLVHVIGVVSEMGYCQLNDGGSKKLQVNFMLKDLSDISLNCTLWEEYAAKFVKLNNERKDSGPFIVMIKYGKIKAEGRYAPSVTNTYSATKVLVNEDEPEIKKFKDSLPKNVEGGSQSQFMCTQSQSGSQFSTDDDILNNPLIMPLADILQLEQISYCVTVAKVEKVNSTKFGWYYLACFKCGKIAKGDKPPYTCDAGHNTETEIVRYKLDLDVSYQDTKTTFVLWDREVTQLLGISAADLRSQMIKAGITNRLEYPMCLDSISPEPMVFKIKWQPRWKTISVVCFRKGDGLVNLIISKFPISAQDNVVSDQPTDVVDKPAHASDIELTEDMPISTQDVSATAEFDPETLSQLTPMSDKLKGKKTIDLSYDDVTPAKSNIQVPLTKPETYDEIIPAKQSSSKRVKIIKTEKK